MTDIVKAVAALREPDASLAGVPNTVRQSLADIIEAQAAEIERLRKELEELYSERHAFVLEIERLREKLVAEAMRVMETLGNEHTDCVAEMKRLWAENKIFKDAINQWARLSNETPTS